MSAAAVATTTPDHQLHLSSPPSSQSLQTDDAASDHQSSSSPPFFHSRTFVFKLILLLSSLLVFSIALVFAIAHWRNNQLNSVIEWTARSCTVISKELQHNPHNENTCRVSANVTGLSDQRSTAYYGTTSDYTLSPEEAQTAFEHIQTQTETKCYVSDQPTPHISLAEPPAARPNSVYIAWTATLIAAIMGVVLITFLSHFLHNWMIPPLPPPSSDLTAPHQAKPTFLTSRQTTVICDNYAHDIHPAKANDWVCSICLEEDPHNSVVKGVRLPCKHAYHQRCIRAWLRKGKSVCPLCNWNVRSVFEQTTPACEDQEEHHVMPLPEQQLPAQDGVETTGNMTRTSQPDCEE